MNFFNNIPKPIWIFALIWFVAGCIQAAFMDLHPDEAYYWQMSRFMDWGYFHQPPMIALFIKLGYYLIPNELGVRFLTVITSTIGVVLLFHLSQPPKVKTFLLVFLGMVLSHAGVFMAVPDAPLIFFTLLFLTGLRSYLENNTVWTAIGLGVIAALLMYSKYHAVVLFGSVLVAVPHILFRKSFWLLVLVAVGLFLPHVLWQFNHDLVSFKFHWVVREKNDWDVLVLLDYLLGQVLILGPVGLILICSQFTIRNRSPFDRVITSIIIGFFGFFLLMALRGKVEANWTAIGFIALIISGAKSIENQPRLRKWLYRTAPIMMGLLIMARMYLLFPVLGDTIKLNFPISGWEKWATTVKDKADGRPVVFASSYQYPSMYSFYSGDQAYHFSPLNYNGNQFELWDIDKSIEGKPFLLISGIGTDPSKEISVEGFATKRGFKIDNYHSFRNLRFEFSEKTYDVEANSTFSLEGKVVNNTGATINLDSLISERPLKTFFYSNGKQTVPEAIECNGCVGTLVPGESKSITFLINVPEKSGKYFCRIGLDFAISMPEQNSDFFKLVAL